MSTKIKSIAFHKEGERLTLKSHKPKSKEDSLGLIFIQAILAVGVLYILANLLLGLN